MKKPSDHTVYATPSVQEPTGASKADATLPPSTQIGEYTVQEVIGKGGFGTVYRAVHPIIAKQAAIKVLCLRYSVDPQVVSRFIAEARAVNQIDHEHIIDIFAFGELPDGRRYYVMEYLEGVPLDAYLKQRGALPTQEVLSILGPLARALDATHACGIAHRDLKPANVYLTRREDRWFPKLLDFGIAKLMSDWLPRGHETATGATIGTPHYMSPEQCRGDDVDHRTDHYAFGVMAFQMLTGRWPFDASTPAEIMVHHMATAPPALTSLVPALSGTVNDLILSLLAKKKEERPERLTPVVRAMFDAAGLAPSGGRTPTPLISGRPDLVVSAVQEPVAAANPDRLRRRWAIGAALVSLCGAVGWMALGDRLRAEPVLAVPVTEERPRAGSNGSRDPPPSQVRVTFEGLPADAAVRFSDGTRRSVVEGTLVLPYGAQALRFEIEARGYVPQGIVLVPDQDQRIEARLVRAVERPRSEKRRAAKKRKVKPRRAGADDLLGWEE